MRQGTTTELEFTSDTDLTDYQLRVNMQQGDKLFVFDNARITKETAYTFKLDLTQEETLALDNKKTLSIQVDIINASGEAQRSNILSTSVDKALNSEVITYE